MNDRLRIEIPRQNETEQDVSLDVISMYEIPGQESISRHSHERYLRDEKQWGEKIREAVSQQRALEMEEEAYCQKIERTAESERVGLIREGLEHPAHTMQKAAVEMIQLAPHDQRAVLIFEAWENPDIEIQVLATGMISCALKSSKALLIRNALNHPSVEIQRVAVASIPEVEWDQRHELEDLAVQKIRDALNDPSPQMRNVAVAMIRHSPSQERAGLIRDALSNSLFSIRAEAAWQIRHALESEQDELKKIVGKTIREGLDSASPMDQKFAAEMIEHSATNERFELRQTLALKIQEGLHSPNVNTQKISVDMIRFVSSTFEQVKSLYGLAKEKMGDAFFESPLYDGADIDTAEFSRTSFAKTGSETTLVGGGLKDRAIVRHIEPEAFLAWKEIFEDYEFWKEEGFDYVPVEPIVSYRLQQDGKVAVFSGVLDLSFAAWNQRGSIFILELHSLKQRILDALEKKGFAHGHAHDGNFCLRFWRDEEGHVDMKKIPRLYLIDFDQAYSPDDQTK